MKKRLPLGRWTKQTSKNNLSEEKNSVPPAPTTVSEEKSRQHEALINSIDQIVLELDGEGTFLNVWASDEQLLYRPRMNCWVDDPRIFVTRIFSALPTNFSSG
jgi:hypothetical protein